MAPQPRPPPPPPPPPPGSQPEAFNLEEAQQMLSERWEMAITEGVASSSSAWDEATEPVHNGCLEAGHAAAGENGKPGEQHAQPGMFLANLSAALHSGGAAPVESTT